MPRVIKWMVALNVIAALVAPIEAGTINTYDDFDTWEADAGEYTSILFSEPDVYSFGLTIVDQYEDEGVIFAGWDALCDSLTCSPYFQQGDGAGLQGGELIDMRFTQPMQTFGAHFALLMDFTLYYEGEIVFSSTFGDANDFSVFGGVVSDQPFDRVVLKNPQFQPPLVQTLVDNVYFGPPIPAPGVLVVFAIGLGMSGAPRRRRNG